MDLGEENGNDRDDGSKNDISGDAKKKLDPEIKEMIIGMSVAVVLLALIGYLVYMYVCGESSLCGEEGGLDRGEDSATIKDAVPLKNGLGWYHQHLGRV